MTTPPAECDIARALGDATDFFITTTLYWDCSCPARYIHNRTMLQCGGLRGPPGGPPGLADQRGPRRRHPHRLDRARSKRHSDPSPQRGPARSSAMNYAPPEYVLLCRCRASGAGPAAAMFCPTGHMTECHYPLPCDQAACGHLPRYDDYSQDQLDHLSNLAQERLRTMADASCPDCSGSGLVDRTIHTGIPTPDFLKEYTEEPTISFDAQAICACAIGPRLHTWS